MDHTVTQLLDDLDQAGIPADISGNEMARRLSAVGLGWRRSELLRIRRDPQFLLDRR